MKKLSYPLLAFLFALTLMVHAKDATTTAPYFNPTTVDFKALLPNPPAVGSPVALQEIDLMLQKQAARTPEEVARIKQEVHLNVDLFENVLGSWFTLKNLPLTAKLLRNVDANQHPIVEAAKGYWDRPRPPLQDKRIHPPIGLPTNASYPSGHSTFGNLNAMVLAELAPDLKDAILARGQQIGDDRVIAGVHFPSDVEAGHTLAQDLFVKLMASPAFLADLAKAKAEVAAARLKH
jgi:acid phosphatase (class A)